MNTDYLTFNFTNSGYINQRYKEFYKKNGYIPQYFNAWNLADCKDFCPALLTNCGTATGKNTLLIIKEV